MAGIRIQQGISVVGVASSATVNAVTIVVADTVMVSSSQAVISGNITGGGATVMSASASLAIVGTVLWVNSPGDDSTWSDSGNASNDWSDIVSGDNEWADAA